MVQSLIEAVSESSAPAFGLEWDTSAARRLISDEELYLKAQAQWKAEQEQAQAQQQQPQQEQDESGEANKETKEPSDASSAEAGASKTQVEEENNNPQVVIAEKKPNPYPTLTIRPLYVNPPKRTRRRGEKSGCAYLVVVAPKIEKIEPIPTEIKSEKSQAQAKTTPDADGEATDKMQVEKTPSTEESAKENAKAIADGYARAMAKGRLLLVQAIEALTRHADADRSNQQNAALKYASCAVEISPSGKTWKNTNNISNNNKGDRREGTIEATADYKNWIKSLTQQQDDLKARPKPTPGGGGVANSAAGAEDESAQPIAALVQHLRAKKEEAKRKKQKKKKEKSSGTAAASATTDGGKKGGTRKKKKKKKSATAAASGSEATDAGTGAVKKKKKKSAGKKKKKVAAAPTPTAILK